MNRREVQDRIFKGLEHLFAPHGFVRKRQQESFVRNIVAGRQSIYVSLVDIEPLFEWSITIAFRFEAVEEMAHLFSGSLPKYQSLSETALIQLDYFTHSQNSGFQISSAEDIVCSIASLAPVFHDSILPVMDECRTLVNLERRVNSVSLPVFNSAQPPYSCLTALALAQLSQSKHFNEVAISAQNAVSHFPSSEREKVTRMVDYLRQHHAE